MARLKGSGSKKLRNVRARSAGGVVFRQGPEGVEIVLGLRRRERDGLTWTLPKGTPIKGETTEETALREVAEETGLEVHIVSDVGAIEYLFYQGGTARVHKTVHFFLMEPIGGDLAAHDHEFEEVRWITLAEAEALMSHETERSIVARATPRILEQVA